MQDLNYYELLELDPDVADTGIIEKRLLEKQRLWSRQTTEGTPRDARIAARNLKLLDTMRRALADPVERTAQAALARQLRDERLRESRSRLTEFLSFAKGRVDDIDAFISRDCARFVRDLGRAEVQRLVAAAGITAAAPRPAPPPPRRETLEPATSRRIREGLEHLNKKDLYDFLGLTRRCTAKSLRDRAEQLNRTLLHSGRSDDQTAASKELAGQCMAVFDSEEGRQRYNNTLVDDTLENTLKDYLPLAGKDNSLSAKAFADLLAIAARQGVPAADAAVYIRNYAQRKRWTVTEGGGLSAGGSLAVTSALPPCGYCGCIPRSENDAFCWNCNRKLTVTCPACNQKIHSSQQTCTACGVNLADAEIVEELFAEARQAAEDGHVEQALKLLNRCLGLWPQWQEALALKERLSELRRRQQSLSRRLVALLRERRMCAAQECLEEAVRECGQQAFMRAAEVVDKALADANRRFAEGEGYRLEGRLEEAGECFEQVLALCTDHAGAQEALRRMPTAPPRNPQIAPIGPAAVRLSWEAGKPDAPFDYTLVRKANGLPGTVDDGETLLRAPSVTYDDVDVCGGVNWYYAVFATRSDLPQSPHSLPAGLGPVFLTPPLTEFTARGDDEQCRLSWTLPQGALAVEIRRTEAPADNGTQQTADAARPVKLDISGNSTSCIDAGLVNNRTYVYTAAAIYADPDAPGQRHTSLTVSCRVSPSPRLDPVTDLRAVLLRGQACLRWTPPAAGDTALLCLRDDLMADLPAVPVPCERLSAPGHLLSLPATGTAQVAAPPDQHVFIPVTVRGNLALPGTPCLPQALQDVRNLAAVPDRGGVLLTWTWPEDSGSAVDTVRVLWSSQEMPAPPADMELGTQDSGSLVCSRARYEADGGCLVAPLPVQKTFVRVCSLLPGRDPSDLAACSEGVTVVCGMGVVDTIRYRVVRTGFFRKTATAVELSCDTLKSVDGLLLQAREGAVPLAPSDGVAIAAPDRLIFQQGRAEIPVPPRFQDSRLYVRLFFTNPDQASCIRLMPGKPEELRLC